MFYSFPVDDIFWCKRTSNVKEPSPKFRLSAQRIISIELERLSLISKTPVFQSPSLPVLHKRICCFNGHIGISNEIGLQFSCLYVPVIVNVSLQLDTSSINVHQRRSREQVM
jgi:hypothetical protein